METQVPGATVVASASGGTEQPPTFGAGQYLQGPPGPAGVAGWASPIPWTTSTVGTVGPPATVVIRSGEVYVCIADVGAGVDPATDGGVHWVALSTVTKAAVIATGLAPTDIGADPTGAAATAAASAVAESAPRQTVTTNPLTASSTLILGHNPCDATAGPLTMTLPADQEGGSIVSVEKVDATTNTVTVSGSIRGAAGTITLALAHETVYLEADDNGSWWPVASHKTLTSLDARYAPAATYLAKTASYTLAGTDQLVVFNGANLTATLPDATTVPAGTRLTVKNANASSLTVTATASQDIDGSTNSKSLVQWGVLRVVSDGAGNWYTI